MKVDNRINNSDNRACDLEETPVIARTRRVGGEVTQRIANPCDDSAENRVIPMWLYRFRAFDNHTGHTGNKPENLTTAESFTHHPFDSWEDLAPPPWWIVPTVLAGLSGIVLGGLWLVGVM